MWSSRGCSSPSLAATRGRGREVPREEEEEEEEEVRSSGPRLGRWDPRAAECTLQEGSGKSRIRAARFLSPSSLPSLHPSLSSSSLRPPWTGQRAVAGRDRTRTAKPPAKGGAAPRAAAGPPEGVLRGGAAGRGGYGRPPARGFAEHSLPTGGSVAGNGASVAVGTEEGKPQRELVQNGTPDEISRNKSEIAPLG